MATPSPTVFDNLQLDHVHFYVGSIDTARGSLFAGLGMRERAIDTPVPGGDGLRSVELESRRIRLLLSEPAVDDHPASAYVDRHGDGVADIALRVTDAGAAFTEAIRRGARPVSGPTRTGDRVTASIMAFGDVAHTFVERLDDRARPTTEQSAEAGALCVVDHFAVCVEHGHLDATVEFYLNVLDFEHVFEETVRVGNQAMTTKVVQSRSGSVTLTLIEPDTSKEPGHIDDFLKQHGGAGVQHIAFATDDIVRAVDSLQGSGVEFMGTPDSYYTRLPERVSPSRYSLELLRQHRVLVDEDHDGQLYQIFTSSAHQRRTLFFELIERMGSRSFGSGNITALYEAAERRRDSRID